MSWPGGWRSEEGIPVIRHIFIGTFEEDVDAYMTHPYHMEHVDRLGTAYFDRSTAIP